MRSSFLLDLSLSQGQRPGLIPAWGIAPGSFVRENEGLKARSIIDDKQEMVRPGFQPLPFLSLFPGALPQAGITLGLWPFAIGCFI